MSVLATPGERCWCGQMVAYGELHWTDDDRHNALRLVKTWEARAAEEAQDAMERVVLNVCALELREVFA